VLWLARVRRLPLTGGDAPARAGHSLVANACSLLLWLSTRVCPTADWVGKFPLCTADGSDQLGGFRIHSCGLYGYWG